MGIFETLEKELLEEKFMVTLISLRIGLNYVDY